MKPRILLVDDDVLLLRSMHRTLQDNFDVTTAEGGKEAIESLSQAEAFAVVVSDFKMPGMDGVHFLDQWGFLAPDTTRIMLTGQASLETAIDAVNTGRVFRFLTKPINGEDLRLVLHDAVNQYDLVTAERTLLEQTLTGSVQTLVELLSIFDSSGFGRSKEIRDLALAISKKFSLEVAWDIELAALLAGIGWLAIPNDVQGKIHRGDRLSAQENDMILRVPLVGSEIIANIPRLQSVAKIIRYSQKSFNGSGYPQDGVRGTELPLGARILRVAHDYTERLRLRQSKIVVFSEMALSAGKKYDPDVMEALGETLHMHSLSEASKTVLLALEELKPGMVLGDDVYTKNYQVMVLPAGTQLNLMHLERLRNYATGREILEPFLVNKMV